MDIIEVEEILKVEGDHENAVAHVVRVRWV